MTPCGAHLGEVADATEKAVGDAWSAAAAPRDLPRSLRLEGDAQEPGGACHDEVEVRLRVEVEAVDDAEAAAQRGREESGTGGGAHQGEGLQGDLHGAGPGAAADHEVEAGVLEGGVQDLLDLRVQAVDLVDEQDLPVLEGGEEGREVPGPFDDRSRGGLDRRVQLGGDDVGQARLADAGRAEEQHVVEGLAAAPAASMATRRLATTWGWPMYSSRLRGLSDWSKRTSSSSGRAETRRGSATGHRGEARPESSLRDSRRRSSNRPSAPSPQGSVDSLLGLGAGVPEVGEGGDEVVLQSRGAGAPGEDRPAAEAGDLVLELEDETLGRLSTRLRERG